MRTAPVAACALLAAAAPVPAQKLTAVLTQVSGEVQVIEAGEGSLGLAALPLQVVRDGQLLRLGASSSATAVCSTDHRVELRGPRDWLVAPERCAAGQLLQSGTYAVFAPHAGSMKAAADALVAQPEVRGTSEDLLVSPRSTALLVPPGEILWRPDPEAFEYEIMLTGLPRKVEVAADSVPCFPRADWEGEVLCALPWPREHPGLEPGRQYFLSIRHRPSLTAPVPVELSRGKASLRLLEPDEAAIVQRERNRLADLALSEPEKLLLAADLYARHRLWAAAIDSYQRACEFLDAPVLIVALADLYAATGLTDFAYRRYESVLEEAQQKDPAAGAAAAAGIGSLYLKRSGFADAEAYFRRAAELYRVAGLSAEADAAAREASAAGERSLP